MPEPKITDADLELLLAEADRDDPILRLPREDAERAARVARLADPRRARLAVAAASDARPERRLIAAACMARGRGRVADSVLAPEHAARYTQRGQPVGARAQQAACRRLHRAVAALLARGRQAAVEPQARGRTGLGEDLEVVEVEAAGEREPRRRQHERAAAALLRRVVRDAHRGRHRPSASARATPAGGAAPPRAPPPALTISCTSPKSAGIEAQRSVREHAGVHVTSSKARSTRSAARYVNGDARSNKNSARTASPTAVSGRRRARRSSSRMTSPIPNILDLVSFPRRESSCPRRSHTTTQTTGTCARDHILVIGRNCRYQQPSAVRPGILPRTPGRTREASHTTCPTAQTSPLRPVVARRARPGSRG